MCLFCSIVSREIPAEILYEDGDCIVINDIHPKARVHMLIIPKKHIPSIADMADSDRDIVGGLFLVARDL